MCDPTAGQESADALAKRIGDWIVKSPFAAQFGIQCMEARAEGYAKCVMTVHAGLLNSVGITHGGALFSFADTTFGIACNAANITAVSHSVHIIMSAPTVAGDRLICEAVEQDGKGRTRSYRVTVTKEADGTPVAFFTGVAVRRKDRVTEWLDQHHLGEDD
uniref:Putative Phenylacetic acid degradation protein PaaD n=1 Tax=Magnetococcus massalia (strain MO-1) TaxID=451514 RepID=A0A1S7LC80_MAGMO|nr:Putative Phenylacetic acid degradation protein PaaD [Candidatus Magnetococcus massalia]